MNNKEKIKNLEFISVATHQLKIPLAAIKWTIKMILDGDAGELTTEQRELLSKCYLSNEKVIRLADNILNIFRIEDSEFGFNFVKTNFQEVVDEAISGVESLISKNHQKLIIQKPEKLPEVYLDKERMIMVMQNLLDNAIKYSPEHGKIEIIIQVDKRFLYVKIKDQGVGIPEKDQSKIFSKFFRATNAIKTDTNGSGLGLFIVKSIIEKHNGKISLKSKEGKGVEASFFIPINK
ncbi:MAG: HAMP domain-containing sensor histidine kinase [Patescibacteria group bacterium]